MLLHVGVAANEDEIEKLKQLGMAFIAQEQLRRDRHRLKHLNAFRRILRFVSWPLLCCVIWNIR